MQRKDFNYPNENKVVKRWRQDDSHKPKLLAEGNKNEYMFTAADLLTVERKEKNYPCIFCNELSHGSSKCTFLLLPLKKDILMEK